MNQFKLVPSQFISDLLNVSISDSQRVIFQSSFIHSSAVEKFGQTNVKNYFGTSEDYEQWEFLGDRVMELISGEYLHDQLNEKKFETPKDVEFLDCSVKFLTKAKSKMVNNEAFASYANYVGLNKYVCVVSKEYLLDDTDDLSHIIKTRENHSTSILGDIFEAFIGVSFNLFGYDVVSKFARNIIINVADWNKILFDDNYKDSILRFYTSMGWGHTEYIEFKKEEIKPNVYKYICGVLSQNPIGFLSNKIVYQYRPVSFSNKKIVWSFSDIKDCIKTGLFGYIAGVGSGFKIKDAEQDASLNALINFGSLLEFN